MVYEGRFIRRPLETERASHGVPPGPCLDCRTRLVEQRESTRDDITDEAVRPGSHILPDFETGEDYCVGSRLWLDAEAQVGDNVLEYRAGDEDIHPATGGPDPRARDILRSDQP